MTQTADVVVIGGGVNGVSIAHALAGRGVRVVLVEKGALASGASGRSSALVRMHYTNEWDARLAWASFPVFRNWPELMGGPPVFTHTGYVDPAETVEGFRRRATLLGARILPWTAVTRIDRGESRVRGVETSAGRIEAGSVVVAAGAWSRRLCQEMGLALPARPKAIDTVAVSRPAELRDPHLVYIDNVLGNYFRPEAGGLTLVGVPCQEWDIDPDTL